MVTAIASSVIGALILTSILAILKSRALFVVAPKLYLNTPLGSGKMVALNVVNAGLAAEEDVAVTLRLACKFDVVATSKSTLVSNGQTISLPRLSRREAVTVLLLINGSAFSAADIESVESKDTKGKVVEVAEAAKALWQLFVAVPLLLLFLLVPFALGTVVGSETGASAFQYLGSKMEALRSSKQLAGFGNQLVEEYSTGNLKGAFTADRVKLQMEEVIRRGDVLTLRIKVINETGEILITSANVEGPAGSRGPLEISDTHVGDVAAASGTSRILQLKAFLPESAPLKFVRVTYRFSSAKGGDLTVTQNLTF